MISIYKNVPKGIEVIKLNDIFFNKVTSHKLDERASAIIREIDDSELISKYAIRSRFDRSIINTDKLSTGCKTVLNVLYNPDKVIDIRECGENAIDLIYTLDSRAITALYPIVSFDASRVIAVDNKAIIELEGYDAIKEWWSI